ncbi:MAG: class I SAM-dependent methyltransferase [Verrucomicrobia bacterium]|nr:MAG: class I SAM-dependent methyltransferase [Verrucomicrobiota bacterium]
MLKEFKDSCKNVLEIGVGAPHLMVPLVGENFRPGASLFAWRDFFQNASVFGLDIDKSILFQDDRIECVYADQSDESSLIEAVSQIGILAKDSNIKFDLIVDDGSHELDHMALTFKVLVDYLKPGGIYIIEDVRTIYIEELAKLAASFDSVKIKYVYLGITQKMHPSVNYDNFLCIQRVS